MLKSSFRILTVLLATTIIATGQVRHRIATTSSSAEEDRELLQESDFSFLGYYGDAETDSAWSEGFSFRYVSGTFRGMTAFLNTNFYLREFTLPASFSQNITWRTIITTNVLMQNDDHIGIWYEQSAGRLWVSHSVDYPQAPFTGNEISSIYTLDVNDSDVESNFQGYWGFTGVGQRSSFGAVRHVPSWFSSANTTGPYAVGFGGYASLSNMGLGPSYGPFLLFFPVLHGVYSTISYGATTGGLATDQFKIGGDYRSGTSSVDWFTDYNGRTFDRGARVTTNVVNWYDGNDSRSNPTTRPTYPTDRSGTDEWWTGENGGAAPNDPDGYARFVWGDSFNSAWDWVDNDAGTRTRHGIIAIASLAKDYAYYSSSSLTQDDTDYEIQIFDPAQVALVLDGTIPGYKLRPTSAFSIRDILVANGIYTGGNNPNSARIVGAAFDPATNRLYIQWRSGGTSMPSFYSRFFVFEVAGS